MSKEGHETTQWIVGCILAAFLAGCVTTCFQSEFMRQRDLCYERLKVCK